MRLQLNTYTQKLDFDVLWFRRRRAHKISKEKKQTRGQKWVGKDETVFIFLPCLSRSCIRPLFAPNFCVQNFRFSGPKIEVTCLIASKYGINLYLINLKLLLKFHTARPHCSRVIRKSLKLRTR